MELSSTMIFAKDMQRMTAFYRHGIGLRLLEERSKEGWAELDAGAVVLALHGIPGEIAKDIQVTIPPKQRGNTPIKLIFRTADVAQARAHLIEHGAVMFEPRPSGACDGMDPEGNVFQIVKA
jgi:catechol 2,3-dioxygenase-like lactoylglutathione lyase family enzyme